MKKLKTRDVLGVEILAVGDWLPASGGTWSVDEATIDRIVANAAALGDLLVPPVKLGHSDHQGLLQADGYPAAGWVGNVRKKGSGDKATLVCDFLKQPVKIADLIDAGAYRKCSVEVWSSFTVDGDVYNDVLTAVSILGNELPAVSKLDDIVALYASKATIGFDAKSQVRLALYPAPKRQRAELGQDVSAEDLRQKIDNALREKFGAGPNGYDWPWTEETFPDEKYVIARTSDGRHWQIPFSIGSDGSVSLGTETEVESTWRPKKPAGEPGENTEEGMAELKRIAAALGLSETATEAEIETAIKTRNDKRKAAKDDCESKGGKWNEESETCEMPATDATLASRVASLEGELRKRDAKDAVDNAIRAKKVAPAQREWAQGYAEKDPEGFKAYVEKTPEMIAAARGSETDAPSAEGDSPVARFQAKVQEKLKADAKLTPGEAQSLVSREDPELFRAAYGRS